MAKRTCKTQFINVSLWSVLLVLNIAGCTQKPQQLDEYTGRYAAAAKSKQYIIVTNQQNQLVLTASWDTFKKPLGHLNGDNFMAKGYGWSIAFTRDKNHLVNGVILMGVDNWKKIADIR